jgi:hypothetical protein
MTMQIAEYLGYFLKTETPFMLMFVILFLFTVKTSRERERKLESIITNKLNKIESDIQVLAKVWQILLEKELEERKK